MRRAKVYVAAVYVACPHCDWLQPSQGIGDSDEDRLWPLNPERAHAYKTDLVLACATCGKDFKLSVLHGTVPLAPADRP